jgi:hypothetical protein
MATATLEDAFEQFKKLPDWDRYPMPEVFYEHFKVKKLQPASINEVICYNPPPYESLNENGKVEIRGPVEGGVRTIENLAPLAVEVKKKNEETGELEEYPVVKKVSWLDQVAEMAKEKIDACNQQDSDRTKLTLPKEYNMKDSQPE